jgi:hypothetical protein
MHTRRLVAASVVALLALALLALGSTLRPGSSEAQSGSMHNCPPAGKWSMAVWSGQSGTAPGDALATCGPGAVDAAYSLDPQTQAWSRWFASKPDVSNLPPLNDMQAVLALGSASAPVVTPTPTSTPTPAPKPAPGTVLYEADWSSGLNGWPGIFGWKALNGMLLNDGTNGDRTNWIAAPYEPGAGDIADYAMEAEIQLVTEPSCVTFGIVAREKYQAGVRLAWNPFACTHEMSYVYGDEAMIMLVEGGDYRDTIAATDYTRDMEWHTHRLEVRGNTIKLLIDGASVVETADNRYLTGGRVGLWSADAQVSVRSFKVIAL